MANRSSQKAPKPLPEEQFCPNHADQLPQQVSELRFVHPEVAKTLVWRGGAALAGGVLIVHGAGLGAAAVAPFIRVSSRFSTPVTGASRWPATVSFHSIRMTIDQAHHVEDASCRHATES